MKKILCLETSGREASVAVLLAEGEQISTLQAVTLSNDRRSAQTLAPAIRDILAACAWKPAEVDLVALTTGPGSFTGLRIGVTTAKVFAYATKAEVVGVSTLQVLAEQISTTDGIFGQLWCVMNGDRGQIVAQPFLPAASVVNASSQNTENEHRPEKRSSEDWPRQLAWRPQSPSLLSDVTPWLEKLCPGDHVTGPILEKLLPDFPEGITIAPEATWHPAAETVGKIAWAKFRGGQHDSIWQLVPNYHRKSAAEEKLSSDN